MILLEHVYITYLVRYLGYTCARIGTCVSVPGISAPVHTSVCLLYHCIKYASACHLSGALAKAVL